MSLVHFQNWLTEIALPYWSAHGLKNDQGGFVEALDFKGKDLDLPQRSMVQARQLYVFSVAIEKGWLPKQKTLAVIQKGADFLIENYQLPDKSFAHAIDKKTGELQSNPDLYSQAFALFGMASAYSATGNELYKQVALDLLHYLNKERRSEKLGYFEILKGKRLLQANPHMHLFEAGLSWAKLDSSGPWNQFLDDIFHLCKNYFIDKKTGFLAEHFDQNWRPLLENNRFIVEPGHLYEWSWLLSRYEELRNSDSSVSQNLLSLAMKHGQVPNSSRVMDEIWSDAQPKMATSRLWPQCEKLKCLARQFQLVQSQNILRALEETSAELTKYLDTPINGLWFDRLEIDGQPRIETVKVSSLYHLVGAAVEVAECKRA